MFKAVELCTNRFDEDTKSSFVDLFTKINGGEDVINMGTGENELFNEEQF